MNGRRFPLHAPAVPGFSIGQSERLPRSVIHDRPLNAIGSKVPDGAGRNKDKNRQTKGLLKINLAISSADASHPAVLQLIEI